MGAEHNKGFQERLLCACIVCIHLIFIAFCYFFWKVPRALQAWRWLLRLRAKIRHSKVNIKNFLCKLPVQIQFLLVLQGSFKLGSHTGIFKTAAKCAWADNTVTALNETAFCSSCSLECLWPCCSAVSSLVFWSSALHHITVEELCNSQEVPSALTTCCHVCSYLRAFLH